MMEKCKEKHWSGIFTCNLDKGHLRNHAQLITWKDKKRHLLEKVKGSD